MLRFSKGSNLRPVPQEKRESPETTAGIFSKLTFSWIGSLMRIGSCRRLEENDISHINPSRASEKLADAFFTAFAKSTHAKHPRPLLHAIYETFKTEFWIGAVCQLCSAILLILTPFALRILISYANDVYANDTSSGRLTSLSRGLCLVFGLTSMQIFQSFTTNHFIYRGMLVGAQVRSCLISLLLAKSLTISHFVENEKPEGVLYDGKPTSKRHNSAETNTWSNGQILSLMSLDLPKIDQAANMFHNLWSLPLSITIALVVLIVNIGYSAIVGYALLLAFMSFATFAIKSLVKHRQIVNSSTELRVSLFQESLRFIRTMKYFGWEEGFLSKIKDSRASELLALQKLSVIKNIVVGASLTLPNFATMVSLVTYSYVMAGKSLDPAPIFSSMALFNALRVPLTLLPMVIGQSADAYAAVQRVQTFLMAKDHTEQRERVSATREILRIDDADFTWEGTLPDDVSISHTSEDVQTADDSDIELSQISIVKDGKFDAQTFNLSNITLTASPGELIAIIGTVKAGKSSLLAALAGNMRIKRGRITISKSSTVAYCPQKAWIQSASIRENILLGSPMDHDRYRYVLSACALQEDISKFPAGDLTEVGEDGVALSGGQKQRINLARVIYSQRDIVLLDDPLSAVDARVSRHIFENAICGMLRDKCCIMSTNNSSLLHCVTRIVWLKNGFMRATGTYSELQTDADFARMMENVSKNGNYPEGETGNKDRSIPILYPDTSDDELDQKEQSVTDEQISIKETSWHNYRSYINASSLPGLLIVLALLVLCQCVNVATNLWLSCWVADRFRFPKSVYIGIYFSFGILQLLAQIRFGIALSNWGLLASRNIVGKALFGVFSAPLAFFEKTPLGRIMGHFTTDVDTLDTSLPDSVRLFLMTISGITAIFAFVTAFYHYFAIVLVPLVCIYVFSGFYYQGSTKSLRRHDTFYRAKVYAQFNEAIFGVSFIRVYGLQEHFVQRLQYTIDQMNSAYFLTFATERWVSLRLDMVGSLLFLVTGLLVVVNRFHVSPSISGLILTCILSVSQVLPLTIRHLADVDSGMDKVERIDFYASKLDQEGTFIAKQSRLPNEWPSVGNIVFKDVQLRYGQNLPVVLDDFSLSIRPGERLGIVGRTGAGKSSLVSLLFRIIQPEHFRGSVHIDGIDISNVPLSQLRSRLTIIPQDPALFRGTIRPNLDPFDEYSSERLWSSLEQVGMVNKHNRGYSTIEEDLDAPVLEEGSNLSHGQRQLLALARAMVRDSQIIVCDEATSSVDLQTDQKLQKTMRKVFNGKTVLCIAHRLRTVLDYDRICVIDGGKVAELDTPLALWHQQGKFREMCENSGIDQTDFVP